MSDNAQARVTLSADDSPLRQSLREMVGKFREFGTEAGREVDRSSAPLMALRDRFIAITAVMAGGALFGKAVQEAAAFTEQSIQLGKALGVSASGASLWIESLKDVDASSQDLASASKGLLKNVRENESGLNDMGLATRDAAGNLRPMNDLMLDAIKLTNSYAAGTDRGVAAQQIFGKGVDASSNLLKLNTDTVRENAQAMRDLGLVVGQDDVEAYERYDSAMDRAKMTIHALMNAIGQALMPALTKLSEWFNAIGPAAVVVTRGAIGGLVSVFWGLKNAVVIAWEVIYATLVSLNESLRVTAVAFYKVVTGDFKGALDELTGGTARMSAAWSRAWDGMLASSEEAAQRMKELFLDGPEAAVPKGGKRATVKGDPAKSPKAVDGAASYMQYYEAVLAEEKRAQATLDAGREYTKEQELAFWRFLSDNLQFTSADKLAVMRKTSALEVEIARNAAQQRTQIDADALRTAEQFALGKVDAEASAARVAVELGRMTKADLARLEIQFEQQRFAVQASALQERLRLVAADPNLNPVEMARLQNELLLLEQQHQTKRLELFATASKEGDSLAGQLADMLGAESTWSNLFNGLIAQTMSWRQAMGSLFSSTGATFVNELVTKPFAAYVGGLARTLAAKMGFLSTEQAAQGAASAAAVGIKAAETTAIAASNAVEAGTGAAASQAAIPVIGPGLALAAMASVFAAVTALGARSARGGYDIPAGLNPMTQLHEEEMVLPSPLANAVRRMAAAGDAPPAASPQPVELRGVSAGDFFIAHRRDLVRVLNGARADFAFR